MAKDKFKSSGGFVVASIGAAVGLGNVVRFPGLCAKFGGGTFLLVYFVALLVMGVPVLNAEIALGRKIRGGAPECMKSVNKKFTFIGWASGFNSLFVAILYSGLIGWIIAMAVKILPVCSGGVSKGEISGYFFNEILHSGKNTLSSVSPLVLICILCGWTAMYLCLKGGASALSKVAKFTVFIPIILLVCMAVRGLLYDNSFKALSALFIPDLTALKNPELWQTALGQVFFSLSVLVGVMPAYGSYLPERANVFLDSLIIATADFFVSVLAAVVLFTTLYGCGLQNSLLQGSGIITAFSVYPVAISMLFGAESSVISGIFGIFFYLGLVLMSVQSSISMIEAVAQPLSEKFKKSKKNIVRVLCVIGCLISLFFSTNVAVMLVDICDYFTNYLNILLLGVAECVVIGWFADKKQLVNEINLFTKRLKMPQKYFSVSLKLLCPVVLSALTVLTLYNLIVVNKANYLNYPVWAQIAFGYALCAFVFLSGFIIENFIAKFAVVKVRRRKFFTRKKVKM